MLQGVTFVPLKNDAPMNELRMEALGRIWVDLENELSSLELIEDMANADVGLDFIGANTEELWNQLSIASSCVLLIRHYINIATEVSWFMGQDPITTTADDVLKIANGRVFPKDYRFKVGK